MSDACECGHGPDYHFIGDESWGCQYVNPDCSCPAWNPADPESGLR